MPSLTEARKAVLQLIAMYDHIHNRDQLPNYNAIKTIAAYLDRQVNLNVEKSAAMDRVGEVDMAELKRAITPPTEPEHRARDGVGHCPECRGGKWHTTWCNHA